MALDEALKACASTYLTVAAGALLAHGGVFPPEFGSRVSRLLVLFFYPVTLGLGASKEATPENVGELWFLLPLPLAHIALGMLAAFAVLGRSWWWTGQPTRRPHAEDAQFRTVVFACVAFTNFFEIPLALVTALAGSEFDDGPFEGEERASTIERGQGMLAVYSVLWNSIAWTWLYDVMRRPTTGAEFSAVPVSAPTLDARDVAASSAGGSSSSSLQAVTNPVRPARGLRRAALAAHLKRLSGVPPLMATLGGVVVGMIKPLRDQLHGDDPALDFIMQPLRAVSAATVPLSMLVVGSSLYAGFVNKRAAAVTARATAAALGHEHVPPADGAALAHLTRATPRMAAGIAFARLVMASAVCALLTWVLRLRAVGFIDRKNSLLAFVATMVSITPTSSAIVIQAAMTGSFVNEVGYFVLVQYVAASLTL